MPITNPIKTPAGYVPAFALGFSGPEGELEIVEAAKPLPVALSSDAPLFVTQQFPNAPVPLEGISTTNALIGPFTPVAGRPVVLSLSGAWEGTAQLMVCEDLCFAGGFDWQEAMPLTGVGYGLANVSPLCNGFKLTGPGWESGFVFSRCEFRFLQMVFHTAGNNNADTHRFIGCATSKCINVNYINNPQSLSINWIGCYVDQIYGNFLEYGPNCNGGGGNFLMQGGAIIALAGGGDTTPHYVVRATAGGTSQPSREYLASVDAPKDASGISQFRHVVGCCHLSGL